MDNSFLLSDFRSRFPDDIACLEEIKRVRFPHGIFCRRCKIITKHYKLRGRVAYTCKWCRNHVYPLSGTLFEKSTTPLRTWFYALFLMTHTQGTLTGKQLQRELGVTYKTAWRIRKGIRILMEQHHGDLLKNLAEREYKEHRWVFFNKLEIKFVQKQSLTERKEKE